MFKILYLILKLNPYAMKMINIFYNRHEPHGRLLVDTGFDSQTGDSSS